MTFDRSWFQDFSLEMLVIKLFWHFFWFIKVKRWKTSINRWMLWFKFFTLLCDTVECHSIKMSNNFFPYIIWACVLLFCFIVEIWNYGRPCSHAIANWYWINFTDYSAKTFNIFWLFILNTQKSYALHSNKDIIHMLLSPMENWHTMVNGR